MEGEIYTQFVRPKKVYEYNSGKSRVEPQGSIPVKEQVERFMRSGVLLQAYKRSSFDAVDEKGTDFDGVDPLSEFYPLIPDADPVEVADLVKKVTARMAKKKAEAEAGKVKKIEEATAKAKAEEREKIKAEVIAEYEASRKT